MKGQEGCVQDTFDVLKYKDSHCMTKKTTKMKWSGQISQENKHKIWISHSSGAAPFGPASIGSPSPASSALSPFLPA